MEKIRLALVARRERLHAQLASMSAPVELDNISFGKRVGEGTSQAVDRLSAVPAHAKLQLMLADILRAERKIDEGTYGSCDVCGLAIDKERLSARPWATRCIAHA